MSDRSASMSDRNNSNWHFDEGKPRVDLIPVLSLIELGRVMDYGAGKYGQHNWSKYAGRWAWTQLIASCLRHLFAWMMGEDLDKESGLNHLAHALANICMLLDLQIMVKGTDDRNPVYTDDWLDVDVLDSAGEPEHQIVSPDVHRSFGKAASDSYQASPVSPFEKQQLEENKEWTERIDDELARIHNIKLGLDPLEIEPIPDMDIEEIPDEEIEGIPDTELNDSGAHWSDSHDDWDAPHGTTHSDELTFPPFAPEAINYWDKELAQRAAEIIGLDHVFYCDEGGCVDGNGEELYP